ncbi:hypothetical protein EPO05_00925 [Patescibacteria group bacterium]|nr:MAG: hypothetical protein EPO05_00925 [Patescibacteria group bacterium]
MKGLTLIETVIAIGILVIGMIGFSLLFLNVWKSNAYTYETGQASIAASQGASKAVGFIRKARQGDDGAYPIKSATNDDLVIFSDYDKDGITERLHFYKDNEQLIMGYRRPSGGLPKTYAAGDEDSIVLAKNVVNQSTEPLFYYFNKNYPGDMVNNPVATPAYVWDIRLVEINLKVNITKGRGPENIEIRSFVEMRNLNDYDLIRS